MKSTWTTVWSVLVIITAPVSTESVVSNALVRPASSADVAREISTNACRTRVPDPEPKTAYN